MIEAACEYIQSTNGKWRQGGHINYPHERGREHQVLLGTQTLLPPLGALCWVTQQRCPLAKLISCTAESEADALGAGESQSWEGFRRICPKETLAWGHFWN